MAVRLPGWNRLPRWGKILYALTGVAVLVAAGLYGVPALQRPDTCHEGVEKIGDECVGVDGAGYDFGNPQISVVAAAIAKENDAIADETHVTVAVMLPLQSDSPGLRRQMRSDLLGAYLGQVQANSVDGRDPKIRLVLANPGRDYAHQDQVVSTLIGMARSDADRLRAVTGFNLTLDATRDAVKRLTENKVPVLASRISGDGIANVDGKDKRFPGLARIIPTNGEAAEALAHFNGGRVREDTRTVLVYDDRPDAYVASLKRAFQEIDETGPAGPADQDFTSESIDSTDGTGDDFMSIGNNICPSDADTIYFAGRTAHLKAFALTLADQACHNRHFTLVSGSDAASLAQNMTEADWAKLRGDDGAAKVTVQYAAPAHPLAWETELAAWTERWKAAHHRAPARADIPPYLAEPKAALDALNGLIADAGTELGSVPLEDSRTMLVYDGLVTIGTALHSVLVGPKEVPSLDDVRNQWSKLQSVHRVRGTSGLICLTTGGNPYDKPVAVVELNPGRSGKGTLEFVGLGWPTGKEQPDNCVIPSGTS
jgi:hypothetical protein